MKDSLIPIAPTLTKGFIVLFVAGAIFGAVLLVELQVQKPAPGSELLSSPPMLIPAMLSGYQASADASLASMLSTQYRSAGLPVSRVRAEDIALRGSTAVLTAARLNQLGLARSTSFRAGVLAGAASAHGIDPQVRPFHYSIADGVVVYADDTDSGRLYVWFFNDAFEELFVPQAIADEAIQLQRSILQQERSSK
ncbi:MAG: hypothetical protein ACYDCC_05070 [Actinomycetota bacterium]